MRPNILLVTVDHWPGTLRDRAGVRTPTLDYLESIGTSYSRAYSECPVCIPARRSLMTGTSPRLHGDRVFEPDGVMPPFPTLASTLSDAGYQCFAVGKLHVYPQRDRIGFHDVLLSEEGRPQLGAIDDYDLHLADRGLPGMQFAHGMSPNDYHVRPWHLSEDLHPTNWTTTQMSRMIRRRDPSRPGFWYMSYQAPHPPLVPPAPYLDMYDLDEIEQPVSGEWSTSDSLPYAVSAVRQQWPLDDPRQIAIARRAFYALCTHLDHQLRVVIGTLREEDILDDTLIVFTSDHGDMLGDHGLFAKRLFYEGATRVPMIVVPPRNSDRESGNKDDRLVALRDVMPTVLEFVGVDVPEDVDGLSMVGDEVRPHLYGEFGTNEHSTRMVTDSEFKLVYYPVGNVVQLFNLALDPDELIDLADDPGHSEHRSRLEALLMGEMYGSDLEWISDGTLVGVEPPDELPPLDRGLHGVRGIHWPPPPLDTQPGRVVGAPEKHA